MKAAIVAVLAISFSGHSAFAVSHAVKMACKDDYFAHCSMHAVGSPGVRQCMRSVGPRLSQRCLGALADAGEIKKSKFSSKELAAKTAKQPAAGKKQQISGKISQNKKLAKAASGKKQKLARQAGGKKQVALAKGGAGKKSGKTQLGHKQSKGKKLAAKKGSGGNKRFVKSRPLDDRYAKKSIAVRG